MEWRVGNGKHYITGTANDLYSHGFHHNEETWKTDTWMAFGDRTIINRDLRVYRRYSKARRLNGSMYFNELGIQTRYEVKRTK